MRSFALWLLVLCFVGINLGCYSSRYAPPVAAAQGIASRTHEVSVGVTTAASTGDTSVGVAGVDGAVELAPQVKVAASFSGVGSGSGLFGWSESFAIAGVGPRFDLTRDDADPTIPQITLGAGAAGSIAGTDRRLAGSGSP